MAARGLRERGRRNVFSRDSYVFKHLRSTKLHHLPISIHLSCERRGAGHFQRGFKRGKSFVKCLRAQKGRRTMPPWRIQTQKGMTAANKTFKPTSVGGGPLKEKIRFPGNVFKIEFLQAFSDGACRTVRKTLDKTSNTELTLLTFSNLLDR